MELGFEIDRRGNRTHKEHIKVSTKEKNFIPYNNMHDCLNIFPFIGLRE